MAFISQEDKTPLRYHVYPAGGEVHVIDGFSCWCNPHLYRFCTQCDGHDPNCWACETNEENGEPVGGVIRIEEPLPGDRVLILHHYVTDDEPLVVL